MKTKILTASIMAACSLCAQAGTFSTEQVDALLKVITERYRVCFTEVTNEDFANNSRCAIYLRETGLATASYEESRANAELTRKTEREEVQDAQMSTQLNMQAYNTCNANNVLDHKDTTPCDIYLKRALGDLTGVHQLK